MEQQPNPASVPVNKDEVLNVKPLRWFKPVFMPKNYPSTFSIPQGATPFGYTPPFGPCTGRFNTRIQFVGPTDSYQTQQTPSSNQASYSRAGNGDVGSSRRRARTRASSKREDGYNRSLSTHIVDAEDIHTVTQKSSRSHNRRRNDNDDDANLILNDILISFDFSANENLSQMEGDKKSVGNILMIYDLVRRKLTQIDEFNGVGTSRRPDLKAGAVLMNKGVRVNSQKRVGAVPGIEVGDIFYLRMELYVIGLHSHTMAGIDYMSTRVGQEDVPLAISVVSSGRYEDSDKDGDVLIYSGQGGNIYRTDKEVKDQKLERGNLALMKSLYQGNEVRVIRGIKDPSNGIGKIYIYDGLYKIEESWTDRAKSGINMFKYKLVRLPGQPQAFTLWQSIKMWKDGLASRVGTVLPDLTSKVESLPVALVNDFDGEKGPPCFTYIPSLKHSKQVNVTEPYVSCCCTNGCLPSKNNCPCIKKNGGYLPHDMNENLVTKRSMVYECGASCQCLPSCRNRISQRGIKVRLEVFKTRDKGWGLRSWDPIRAGAYICEFAGEVIDKSQLDELRNSEDDDYIFDATRTYQSSDLLPAEFNVEPKIPFPLYINAKDFGNVARFMNHSCSPNVFWQPVLRGNATGYDVHIVFHAIRHIPPMVELTYDYGIPQPDIANQLKIKCVCGSEKCKGYLC